MSRATEDQLASMHGLITQDITRDLQDEDPDVRRAARKSAIDWCKHNSIKVEAGHSANPDWAALAAAMAATDDEERTH